MKRTGEEEAGQRKNKRRTLFKLSVPQRVERLDLGHREETAEVLHQQEMFPLRLQKLN